MDQEARESQIQNLALIGQLAGGIAHDFNNLLTAMLFNLEIVKRETRDKPELEPSLRALDLLLARASTTTRQLLTFARQRSLDAKPLEVHALLGQSLELLGRLLGESIEVFFLPSNEKYWIRADASMVDHAVLNLCFNARDAMPHGGVLTVETRFYRSTEGSNRFPDVKPGDFVEVRFSDTGRGIAPEHLSRVFEPFFTTKESGKGTGLGLASVYGGARQHGGWAEVESTLGQGTTLSIYLPLIAEPNSGSSEDPHGTRVATKGTLLVVDDDPAVREAMAQVLEGEGYAVHRAANAAEGWSTLRADPAIDLVVTDWMMPGALKGLEWATRIKAEQPDLAVILMSGYADEARSGPAIQENLVLLNKPFRIETVTRVIENCLANRKKQTPEVV